MAGATPDPRYPLAVRWSRERGWLDVCDVARGEWWAVAAQDAPPSWRSMARAERLEREKEREKHGRYR